MEIKKIYSIISESGLKRKLKADSGEIPFEINNASLIITHKALKQYGIL